MIFFFIESVFVLSFGAFEKIFWFNQERFLVFFQFFCDVDKQFVLKVRMTFNTLTAFSSPSLFSHFSLLLLLLPSLVSSFYMYNSSNLEYTKFFNDDSTKQTQFKQVETKSTPYLNLECNVIT
ncbi:uncharacterized protein DS421_7g218930 [Arachis hypogaea]|nr:uncharacterized protein DS421_7g218930 [Arachis hypogaea]